MSKYVLHSKGNGYFKSTYQCKGALDDVVVYPSFTDKPSDAKQWTTYKRVESFIKSFSVKNPLDYEWNIKEVQ